MLFFLLLLAMPVAAYWFMFTPAEAEMRDLRHRTADKEQQLQDLHAKMERTKDMVGEVEKLRKAVAFFESKLPEEKEMANVLREVSQIAQKNNLNTKSFRALKVIQGPSYSEQPIKMNFSGPMKDGFYKFLCDIEHLQRLTRINAMKIDADEKVPGNVNVEMVLTIYFDASQKVAVAQ